MRSMQSPAPPRRRRGAPRFARVIGVDGGSCKETHLSGGETIVELAFPLAGAFLVGHLGSCWATRDGFCFWPLPRGSGWTGQARGPSGKSEKPCAVHPTAHLFEVAIGFIVAIDILKSTRNQSRYRSVTVKEEDGQNTSSSPF